MECIYCGAALDYHDSYGNSDYICRGDIGGKSGDIYKCPHSEGFNNIEDVLGYLELKSIDELNKYLEANGMTCWEEVSCESACHNVSGSFYTDKYGDLKEGYPC